ncbi:MAG: hypothetical protein IKG87_00860 [Clostridia bacterium]|nr:hypothetical protein [Clostridia bacterium]MBR4576274.1 hypothetical protein [Clostridia bacterium]
MEQRNNDLSDHARLALNYLEQVHFWQSQIDGLKEKLELAETQSLSLPSSSDFSGEKVCRSFSGEAPFESAIAKKDLLKEHLTEISARLAPLKEQAAQIIRRHTTFIQQRVLLLHFIDGYPWSLVAMMVSRTERQVYRIRIEALEQILLPEDAIWL